MFSLASSSTYTQCEGTQANWMFRMASSATRSELSFSTMYSSPSPGLICASAKSASRLNFHL